MRFRYSLLTVYTVPSALSLSPFSRLVYKYLHALNENSAVPYNTSQFRFPSHLLAASNSSTICVHLLQQVRGSCSYVLCPRCQFHLSTYSQFSSSYSDRVRVCVSFHSLWLLPVSVLRLLEPPSTSVCCCLCFCLLTQRHSGASPGICLQTSLQKLSLSLSSRNIVLVRRYIHSHVASRVL